MVCCALNSLSVRFFSIISGWHGPTLLLVLLLLVAATGQAQQEADISNSTIAENQAVGTPVGTFSPATALFSLESANVPFAIINRQLVTTDSLNFEEIASYNLAVAVAFLSSSGANDSIVTEAFAIGVLDVNDPPVVVSQTPLATPENEPLTLALGNLTVSDEDADDTYPVGFTLRVVPGQNYSATGLTITPAANFSGALTVPVVVNDGEDDSAPFPLTVTVQALPRFSVAAAYEVNEDFAEPEQVSVVPEDPEQEVTYEITPGPEEVDFATLTADNSNGIYLFEAQPDKNGEEAFTITATSDEQNTFAQEFTFRVNAVNDAPQFAGVAGNDQTVEAQAPPVTVPNFATGIAPGPPTATDEDNQTVSFAVTTSDDDLFIQPPTITPNGTLTYQPADDKIGTAQVSVVLRDNGRDEGNNVSESAPQTFAVEVAAPLSPSDFSLNNLEVLENQPITEVIGQFTGSGNYRFDGGPDDQRFRIDDNNLFARESFNFENPADQELEIRVERRFGFLNLQRESENFTIRVLNVEEPPTGITLSANAVSEGAAVGTRVGFLAAQGGAPEVPVTYQFVGGPGGENNGQFTIVNDELRINVAPDFETTPQYSVRIQATGDGVSPAQNFTVVVINNPEPPTDIVLDNTAIDEGVLPGRLVGTLSATGGSPVPITYALSGPGAGAFTLNANQLLTQGPLNFETQPTYNITITATGDGSFTKEFTITVNNVPEPPTDIVLSNSAVNEGAPVGTVVGTLGASGGEVATTFELVDSEPNDNGSFSIEGNQLITAAVFNFETKESYAVRVRATGDGSFDKTLTVTVVDQPDPPTDITLSSTTVNENQPDGTVVGTLSATGGAGPYTFTLPGGRGNNGAFTIVDNQLFASQPFNFEQTPIRTVVIVASNADGPFEKIIELTIGNLPEPPTEITLAPRDIRENEPIGTTVGRLTASGGSGGDATFALAEGPGGSDNDRFTIEGDELKSAVSFNHEFKETYQVRVRATAEGSFIAVLTISVIDVNEAPVLSGIERTFLNYAEGEAAKPITESLAVNDPEDNVLTRAEVFFSDDTYVNDEDELSVNAEGIQASWNAEAGRLTITGSLNDDQMQQVLRAVRYTNLKEINPTVSTRRVTFVVNDGTNPSNTQDRFIRISDANIPPVLADISLNTPRRVPISPPQELFAAAYGGDEDGTGFSGTIFVLSLPTQGTLSTGTRPLTDDDLGRQGFEVNLTTTTLTYTPSENYVGTDRFRWVARDNEGQSGIAAEVIIKVLPQNAPPVVSDVEVAAVSGVPYSFAAATFQTSYNDPDNRPQEGIATLQITALPRSGFLLVGTDTLTDADIEDNLVLDQAAISSLSYVSSPDFTGEDSLGWNASDGADFAEFPAQVIITVSQSDLRAELGETVETCPTDSVRLTVNVQGGTPPYRYIWSANGETLTTNDELPVLPTETTTYRVAVTDANGTIVADSVRVELVDCPNQTLDIPSAFTPNGDGDNDLWEVGNLFTYDRSVVEIYDRYGHRLFRSEGDPQSWDGQYQGEELPVGTYYYSIVLNNGLASYKGSVTILR